MPFTKAHTNILADVLTDEQREYLTKFSDDIKPGQVAYQITRETLLKELAGLEIFKWSRRWNCYVLTAIGRKVVTSLKRDARKGSVCEQQ